jgi:hypothetical protein
MKRFCCTVGFWFCRVMGWSNEGSGAKIFDVFSSMAAHERVRAKARKPAFLKLIRGQKGRRPSLFSFSSSSLTEHHDIHLKISIISFIVSSRSYLDLGTPNVPSSTCTERSLLTSIFLYSTKKTIS